MEQRLLSDLGSGARGGAAAAILPRSLGGGARRRGGRGRRGGNKADPVRLQPLTLPLLSLLFLIKLLCPLSIGLVKKLLVMK